MANLPPEDGDTVLKETVTKREFTPRNKQSGYALIDNGFAILIFLLVAYIIFLAVPPIMHQYKMFKLNSQISEIQNAARSWKGQRTNYTGITHGDLCTRNYLTNTLCGPSNDAVAANPWGGNYTVAVNTNASLIDIAITGIDSDYVLQVADSLAPITDDNCTSSDSCNTLDVTGTTVTLTM